MFMFHWPWLSLLLPLPLLARYILHLRKNDEANSMPGIRFPRLQHVQMAFGVHKRRPQQSSFLFLITLSLLWLCLVLAIMRPQFVDQVSQVESEGYDLMLAVDISGSMKALDFSTQTKAVSRLDATKNVVRKFVEARQGDRIGLILFGEKAYLQVPLTLDVLSVNYMLSNAASGMAGQATAIGDAIGLSVKILRDRPEGSRVLILLTDGLDTSSSIPPLEAAKLAKQYGIRIYTIGVGHNGLVPYPDDGGGIIMVKVPMDETLLKQIASITHGSYFRATDQQSLEAIYKKIDELEKTKANVRTYFIHKPLYPYPLAMAVLLFLTLCLGLPLYRRVVYGT